MFTGIIRDMGEITNILQEQSNCTFFIKSTITSELKIDESISHNGVCLTVEDIQNDIYRVTAIAETLEKTNAGTWKLKDVINLERSMKLGERLDGHIVQGHIDGTGVCTHKEDKSGSVEFTFEFNAAFAALIIEKGSVCVNGVSLTAFDVTENKFTVAIIPYTMYHTNFSYLNVGDSVNLEFDILGKYVARIFSLNNAERKEK